MDTIHNQLFLPYTQQLGMRPVQKNPYKNCGLTYTSDPSVGDGFYWIYYFENLFAVTVYKLALKQNVQLHYNHPEFFTLGSFNTQIAQFISNQDKPVSRNLMGYFRPEGTFHEMIYKGSCVEGVSISLSTSYIDELCRRFEIEAYELKKNCFNLYGTSSIPEAEIVLRQMHFAKPINRFSKMYYETKITELISIILQWQEEENALFGNKTMSELDNESLHCVTEYLRENYSRHTDIRTLESIAYMGRNKLSHEFKKKYGVTITEYLKKIRVEHAKALLEDKSITVGEIATIIGYQRQGSFTDLFKQATGFTPLEYRKSFFY